MGIVSPITKPVSSPPEIVERARRRALRLGASPRRPDGTTHADAPQATVTADEALARRPIVERSGDRAGARRDRTYRRSLAISDGLAMLLSLFLSLQFIGGAVPRVTALLAIPAVIVVAKSIGLYDRDELLLRKTTLDEAPQLFHVATVVALVGALLDDKLVYGTLSKEAIALLWASSFTSLLLFRYGARSLVTHRVPVERCLILGSETTAEEVTRKMADTHAVNAQVVDRISFVPGQVDALIPRLERAIAEGGIGRVIVAPEQVEQSEILDVVRAIKAVGVNVTLVPRIFEVLAPPSSSTTSQASNSSPCAASA